MVELATRRYAAYLAYQSYSDRAKHIVPGSVDQNSGVFKPRKPIRVRDTGSKLADLKKLVDEIFTLLLNYSNGSVIIPETSVADDAEGLDEFKYNDLPTEPGW